MKAVATPIADFVTGYVALDISRLHMPGHKGRGPLGCEARDITEVQGADSLYEAGGIIAESEANAARLFGTGGSCYSTEGSSQCIRAMLFLALQAAGPLEQGQRPLLLAARNAHRALLDAAALLDFDIEWLWPVQGTDSLCCCPIDAGFVRRRLAGPGRRPFALYLTSPDYLGGMQDIPGVAAACRVWGVPLLVDNAHGAYLKFLPGGSRHPIDQGADLCCDSAHKTLPVLTGGAYLHLARDPGRPAGMRFAPGEVRRAMALFGSTSPSYLILQSLDLCNRALAGEWTDRLARCVEAVEGLKAGLEAMASGLVRPSEPLKVVLDSAAVDSSGPALATALRARGAECEYADSRYVVLMFTPGNLPRDYARVRAAAADAQRKGGGGAARPFGPLVTTLVRETYQVCTIRQAVFARQELIPVEEAAGRVCAMPTVSCPPGVPVVVSGEQIGPTAVRMLEAGGVRQVAVVGK